MLVVKTGSWFFVPGYLSFPGSSLGTLSSCGNNRFLKMWLEPQKSDVPRLEPGNKKKIPVCMFMGTGTPALIIY